MYHGTFHGTRSGVFGLKILYRHNKKELCLSTNYAKEVELVFFSEKFSYENYPSYFRMSKSDQTEIFR